MTIVGGILLAGAVILWIALAATAGTLHSSDPAGNALSSAYSVFIALGLWALMAVLLVIAAIRGEMPGWSRLAALILVPGSCAATLWVLRRMSEEPGLKWPVIVLVLIPALILAFAVWSYFPGLRARIPGTVAGGIAWGGVLLLTVIPGLALRQVTLVFTEVPEQPDTPADLAALEAIAGLGPDARLDNLQHYRARNRRVQDSALARARTVPTRQADAEKMLREGNPFPLYEVKNLSLTATPEFCQAAERHLVRTAESWRNSSVDEVSKDYWSYLDALAWLKSNSCDITTALDAIESSLRSYRADPLRDLVLESVIHLRH